MKVIHSILLIISIVVIVLILTILKSDNTKTIVNQFLTVFTKNPTCTPILATPLQFTVTVPTIIPIFMYWNSEKLPPTVDLCWKNWNYFAQKSKHNFHPVLVTDNNVATLIDIIHPCIFEHHKYPASKSDFIRLALLQKHGGIYMDATVILTEPLDWVIGDGSGYNFFQAYANQRNMNISCQVPIVENSFLAAPPNHPFINEWLNELLKIEKCEDDEMAQYVKGKELQKHLQPLYHIAYHALTNVLMRKPLKDFPNVFITNNNNFLNFINNGNVLILSKNKKVNHNKMLKLISSERKEMDSIIQTNKIEKNSFMDNFLISIH